MSNPSDSKGFSFPLFKTRIDGETRSFALDDPIERRKYFDFKAGNEIDKLRDYLRDNTFIAFLLGKKNSGKGTYSKLFMEAVGQERVAHISVGDIVRRVHEDLSDERKKRELMEFLNQRYRGFISAEEALQALLGRDTKNLLPAEIMLALVEREIDTSSRKAIFIDGFPRSLDQVAYSLYFRALIGYRDDPDFFIFIDVPESIINERIKYRVVCPTCHTPRNMRVLRTKEIEYDAATKRFYLICDNPKCGGLRMVSKEGDELGIEVIRERIEVDEAVMKMILKLQGVPKIYLRNAVPAAQVKDFVDDYEITPSYRYEWDDVAKHVRVIEEPWTVPDDHGVPSHSLLPAAVTVSLIKQMVSALKL